jgi:hypothetical protein
MGLFFFLAGYFTAGAFDRKGVATFLATAASGWECRFCWVQF